jgi:hypothetical protein
LCHPSDALSPPIAKTCPLASIDDVYTVKAVHFKGKPKRNSCNIRKELF